MFRVVSQSLIPDDIIVTKHLTTLVRVDLTQASLKAHNDRKTVQINGAIVSEVNRGLIVCNAITWQLVLHVALFNISEFEQFLS